MIAEFTDNQNSTLVFNQVKHPVHKRHLLVNLVDKFTHVVQMQLCVRCGLWPALNGDHASSNFASGHPYILTAAWKEVFSAVSECVDKALLKRMLNIPAVEATPIFKVINVVPELVDHATP